MSLRDNTNFAPRDKSGSPLGTSDNWTFGFTPECTVGVWVGRPEDYDTAGRVRLREDYRAWVESDQNTLGDLLAGRRQTQHLRIREPATGALYYRDPDIPEQDQRLALRAESTGHVEWSSSTLDCRAEGAGSPSDCARDGTKLSLVIR